MGYKFVDYSIYSITAIIFCCLCFLLPARAPSYFEELNRSVSVTITSGMSARDAAIAVKNAGVITGKTEHLVDAMAALGIDRTLRPGTYELKRGSAISVAQQLKIAKPTQTKLTLIPGYAFSDAASLVGGKDALMNALSGDDLFPPEMHSYLPKRAESRIIFLLPETYFLSPGGDTAGQLVKRASALWYKRVGSKIENDSPEFILKRGILASLVEGEAKEESERPVLAGIFLKRIAKSMRLQSCATVIYCWRERGEKKKTLSYEDLEIDSPYNTYKHDGLPPGPISFPSQPSWESALNPAATDYLFFFADGNGRHIFSKTYKEHMNKQKAAAN